jgi:hypothetical protein
MYRKENRIGASEPSTVTILGHPDVSLPCEIKNFSPSGMCISVGQKIPAGSAVKVNWDSHFLVGRVRRGSAEGPTHRIGVELLYCSQWRGSVEPASARRHAAR